MSKKAIRVIFSVVVILGATSALLFTTMSEDAQPYKHVDEVAANPQEWYGKSLQLHGFVTGTVMVDKTKLEYQFDVETKGQVVKASYTGVVPDTFKTGAEVVLKGRLAPHGFQVEPDGVMAKCPSKYTPAGPAGQVK